MGLLKEKKENMISFDGKTLKGTLDEQAGKRAVHLLNAWSLENGICLGQRKVDDKSNEITAIPELAEWAGIKSIGMVIRERATEKKTSKEIVYYISSCDVGAKLLGESVRNHWQVENGLHWSLDVIFREDKLRYRHEVGARNLATIRKITLGALRRNKTYKCGKAGRRIMAASDPLFREEVLKNLF